MHKGRLEAFSDGVIAIIITIMVLDLRVPHAPDFTALRPLLPVFLCYAMSFLFVATYWNNHHHLMQAVRRVSGPILWTNMHLLFWLSLVPFATAWMGENNFACAPVALYGFVCLACGVAYWMLVRALLAHHGRDSELGVAIGSDVKGRVSLAFYLVGIVAAALAHPWVGLFFCWGVTLMWFIPDRRIERALAAKNESPAP